MIDGDIEAERAETEAFVELIEREDGGYPFTRYGLPCWTCGVVRDYHDLGRGQGHAYVRPGTTAEREASEREEANARRVAAENLVVLTAELGGTIERFRYDAGTSIMVTLPGARKRFTADDGENETADQRALAWVAYRKDGGTE